MSPNFSSDPMKNGSNSKGYNASSLDAYFKQIQETPLLTKQDEQRLGEKIQKGDMEARDQMIRANLALVVNIARNYYSSGLSLEDLVAEGNLGLIHAVEKFKITFNKRFSTYASHWIKQAIRSAIYKRSTTIKVPQHAWETRKKIHKMAAKIMNESEESMTTDEAITVLQLPKSKMNTYSSADIAIRSNQICDDEEDMNFMEQQVEDRRSSPLQLHESDENLMLVREAIARCLNEREAYVIKRRYGLDNSEPSMLKELGAELQLTKERIRQIEVAAVEKLRSWMESTSVVKNNVAIA